MTPVAWMIGAGFVCWLAVVLGFGAGSGFGPRLMSAALWGTAGPLVVAVGSWMMAERTYRRNPAALTGLMMAGFVGKMVFFGAYVAGAIKVFHEPAVPFAVSLTGSFISLHLIEALALRRLFAS